MAKVKPLVLLPLVIFAGLAGLFAGGMYRDNPGELPSTMIGRTAPDVPRFALDGQELLTADDFTTGEVTLVNFWASWCPPCRAEHPVLLEMAEQGIRVAGVNFRDPSENAEAYLSEYDDPFFAGIYDRSGRTSLDWGVTAPPETFIIDGEGEVLFRFTGPLIGTDYERRFVPALNEALGR